jgi:N utilization substance protein A
MKGSRVQSIIRELRGEKIDIIEHSDDLVTFAQSALAPAKITRVSVHHTGEHPHLDVIVEDEQLSLAIGKRGQNVRLAAELIGCRIDIKSESDVKDEVADALARMLQGALGAEPQAPLVAMTDEIDIATVPGVGVKTAADLQAAGFTTLQALFDATTEDLQQVEGVGPKTAQAILNWAAERAARAAADVGRTLDEPEAPVGAVSGLQDDDFLAALSRAFKESEESARAIERTVAEAEADAEATRANETEPEPASPAVEGESEPDEAGR